MEYERHPGDEWRLGPAAGGACAVVRAKVVGGRAVYPRCPRPAKWVAQLWRNGTPGPRVTCCEKCRRVVTG